MDEQQTRAGLSKACMALLHGPFRLAASESDGIASCRRISGYTQQGQEHTGLLSLVKGCILVLKHIRYDLKTLASIQDCILAMSTSEQLLQLLMRSVAVQLNHQCD